MADHGSQSRHRGKQSRSSPTSDHALGETALDSNSAGAVATAARSVIS
ncbi:Uncharacterised protein [Vibrio cholerae]|nr:Uncharacterised protein [Vibrio cholerae]